MNNIEIENFIEKIKLESSYIKFVSNDIIYKLISIFNHNYDKLEYPNKINNPLELALQFYKEYSLEYYNIIINGIKNNKIVISYNNKKSFVDVKNNLSIINLCGNDSDVFIIVHELSHYVDKNSNPQIVSNEHWFLSETFAFYMEKKLESWLDYEEYRDLILSRQSNRLYYESQMLNAIKYMLEYEKLYKKNSIITKSDLDTEKIKLIKRYNESNLINYLLQYPIANIISSYLLDNYNYINDCEFDKICLNLDLFEVLECYSKKNKYLTL